MKVSGRVIWGACGEGGALPTYSEATAIQNFPLTTPKVSQVPEPWSRSAPRTVPVPLLSSSPLPARWGLSQGLPSLLPLSSDASFPVLHTRGPCVHPSNWASFFPSRGAFSAPTFYRVNSCSTLQISQQSLSQGGLPQTSSPNGISMEHCIPAPQHFPS